MDNDFVSISITDGIEKRKVAFVKIGYNDIVAGGFKETGELDIHATYHIDGHCHVKTIKEKKVVREFDLFDGYPMKEFKGKINLFNRLFPTDISKLPRTVSIPSDNSEEIKLKFSKDILPHMMSIFLIESGGMDYLPDISKKEYILYDKSSPWILITFFSPTELKWNDIIFHSVNN